MKNVIRVSQLKLKPDESEKKLKNMIIHTLKLPADAQIEWKIFKKSLDARHKPDIYYVYSVDVYNVIISGKNTALNDIIEGKIKNSKRITTIKNKFQFSFPLCLLFFSFEEIPLIMHPPLPYSCHPAFLPAVFHVLISFLI